MYLQVLVIRVDLSLRATTMPATPWVEASNRGSGETPEPRDPAVGERVSTSQGQPAQRESFFAALCSQPGQWDPSVNEGPPNSRKLLCWGASFQCCPWGQEYPLWLVGVLGPREGPWEGPLFV